MNSEERGTAPRKKENRGRQSRNIQKKKARERELPVLYKYDH